MKKILFSLIAIISFTSIFAQQSSIVSGKISSNISSIDIPIELKSDLLYETESFEFIKTERYISNLKGNIVVITDSKDKIVAVTLPMGTSLEKVKSIGKCFTTSFWNHEGGTGWSGFWNCLIN